MSQANFKTLNDLLQRSTRQIALALPKHLTPERMIRVALTAWHRTPALQECSPMSIVGAVVQASELGLELTGPLGQAYLVPFWNKNTKQKEAQFIVGYRGFIDLAYRSGRVETFCAHVVSANDVFEFEYGTSAFLRHKPARSNPGEVTDVYAVCKQKGGGVDFEVMSREEIDSHRERYSKAGASDYSPWVTAWAEMAKKTPLRRLAKRVPLSVELVTAATLDEMADAGLGQELARNVGGLPQLTEEPPVGKADFDRKPEKEPEKVPAANGNGHAEKEDPMTAGLNF